MQQTNGFSFLEVLISLAIFSFALLSLMQLQICNLQTIQQDYFYALAVMQLQAMTERIKANHKITAYEVNLWNQQNKQLLPQGQGEVSVHNPYQIQLSWFNKRKQQQQTLKTSVVIGTKS